MPRSSWKGFIRLSLVSVPVKAFSATTSSGSGINLNQLHDACHSRIRYEKTCPIHGAVSNDEIVKGYEYAKGQYAVIDLEELDKLRSEGDKSINIDAFVRPEQVDPLYFSGKNYFLAPDGPAGQKPYALLQQAMAEENMYCVAQVVFSGREQVVLLRPVENLLCMSSLHYDAEVKKASGFQDELTPVSFSPEELKLTKMLIEATASDELEMARYEDLYTTRLTELIQAKVEGKELVTPPAEEAPSVINLMDALRASVEQAREKQPPKEAAPTKRAAARRVAPSASKRKTTRKSNKKTG